jgi:hypothetical protein
MLFQMIIIFVTLSTISLLWNIIIKIKVKKMEKKENELKDPLPMKSLLVLFSYHHQNTEKIANVFAKVLDAKIKTPQQISPEELKDYSLIGFGSGIYGGKHHEVLLTLLINFRKSPTRKHSFSQPVESQSSYLMENNSRTM